MGLLIQGDWDCIVNPIKLKFVIKYGLKVLNHNCFKVEHQAMIQNFRLKGDNSTKSLAGLKNDQFLERVSEPVKKITETK